MFGKVHFKILVITAIILIFITGCYEKDNTMEKVRELDYSVIGKQEVPEELLKLAEEKKTAPFKLTYSDDKNLYIAVGYGEQSYGEYKITVKELYLSPNSIVLDTELSGPGSEADPKAEASYPYIIIKTEYLEEPVIFQ